MHKIILYLLLLIIPSFAHAERIKDLVNFEDNTSIPLVGYGIVVGLNGTGDSTSSPQTLNSLVSLLERSGVNIKDQKNAIKPKNIASVMVTATLPYYAEPGTRIDVSVASVGDAKSLRGGTLLITQLRGGDGKVYAVAQGPISVGGFSVSGNNASATVNHPTSGQISNGAMVEANVPLTKYHNQKIRLLLKNPDYTLAKRIERAINKNMHTKIARATEPSIVEVWNTTGDKVELLSQIEQIEVMPDARAIVIIDEKTGTIVMGKDVKIDPVAVSHGNLSVTISETPIASQPNAGAFATTGGTTKVLPRTNILAKQDEAKLVMLPRQPTLNSLVAALNSIGATTNDLIAILQSIKAAGALHADLIVK